MVKYLACALLLFSSLAFGFEDPAKVDYLQFQGAISGEVIHEVCRRFDVTPGGQGGGGMDVIRSFSYMFDVFHPITKEEARRIIVECGEIFLKKTSENRAARPYFIEYPMGIDRVSFAFFVYDPKTHKVCHENSVSVFYTAEDKKWNTFVFYSVETDAVLLKKQTEKEPFEVAEKIVQQERQQDPSLQRALYKSSYIANKEEKSEKATSFLSKLSNLINFTNTFYGKDEKYNGPTYEQERDWALDTYCQKLAKEHQLQFFRVGPFNPFCTIWYHYGFSFLGSQKLALREARLLGATVMQSLIHELNTSSMVRSARENEFKWKSHWNTDVNQEIPLKETCMKIAFWDENYDRIQPPHIAQIAFLEEKLQYFEADPQTQKLRLIFSEPYQDALKFLLEEQQKEPKTNP
jgi:hypothetical protein